VILSITVTACAGVKSTNVVCPHNGTYDLCIFVIFSETSFVDVCAANHRFPQITFEALRTGCPPYLTDFLQHHQPTRSSHLSLLLFRNITYRLDPVLSALQPHVSGTPCLSILANPSRFLLLNVIWILISVLQIIALVNYHTFIWKIIWWRRKRWSKCLFHRSAVSGVYVGFVFILYYSLLAWHNWRNFLISSQYLDI